MKKLLKAHANFLIVAILIVMVGYFVAAKSAHPRLEKSVAKMCAAHQGALCIDQDASSGDNQGDDQGDDQNDEDEIAQDDFLIPQLKLADQIAPVSYARIEMHLSLPAHDQLIDWPPELI